MSLRQEHPTVNSLDDHIVNTVLQLPVGTQITQEQSLIDDTGASRINAWNADADGAYLDQDLKGSNYYSAEKLQLLFDYLKAEGTVS